MKSKLIAVLLPLLGAASALAQSAVVPALLSYQGRVTDSSGVLIGSTTPVNRAVKFQLYTASSGGTAIWAETQTVTISGGEFSVLVGNGTGIAGIAGPSAPAPTPYKTLKDVLNSATTSAFYLGVTVDDGNSATVDAEISPRQQLVSGAFALRAAVAETVASSAVTTAMVADSSITTGKIADANVTTAKIADGTIAAADIAAGAITSAKIDSSSVGLWSVSGSNVYRSSGNVGVGTASPNAPLHAVATSSTDPSANGVYVFNPTNSANNNAVVSVRTAGSSAGNPFVSFDVAGINGWSVGIDNADSQKFKISNTWSSLATNPRLTITSPGNVGIGTTTPARPLSFADGVGDKISLSGQNTSNYGIGIQPALLQLYSDAASADIAFGYGSSYNFTERMRVKGTGYVGIGTNSPGGMLHLNESTGTQAGVGVGTLILEHQNNGGASSVVFRSKNNFSSDYGYIQYQDDASVGGAGEQARLVIATQNDADDYVILQPTTGRVGIGTMSPVVQLDVRGKTARTQTDFKNGTTDSGDYSDKDHDSVNGTPSTGLDVTIRAEGYVESLGAVYYSDRRIKEIVDRVEPARALSAIESLQPTNYRMIDRTNLGAETKTGLIAQEVQAVIPEAVSKRVDFVPDIYAHATTVVFNAGDSTATVTLSKPHGLVVGDVVRVYDDAGLKELGVVSVSGPVQFTVSGANATSRLFVYGKRVNDFLAVDYDRVFVTGLAAIQELSAEVKEKDARIADLEQRLAALEKLLAPAK
jgi:hypothetical protein